VDEITLILREVSILAALSQPGSEINLIKEAVIVGNKFCIVTEYAPFGNLYEHIKENKQGLSEP
jgi:serine/threonine protein kinase